MTISGYEVHPAADAFPLMEGKEFQHLADDIGAGIRAGVRATPTYAVGSVLYTGRVPAEVLASISKRGAAPPSP